MAKAKKSDAVAAENNSKQLIMAGLIVLKGCCFVLAALKENTALDFGLPFDQAKGKAKENEVDVFLRVVILLRLLNHVSNTYG